MDHLISINLHVHNRDKYLDKFLEMLNNQTYKNFELNIFESANLDSTIAIIKKYCNLFSINCWRLHTKFVDRTKSLNFLIKQSQGDIICIADVDVMKMHDYLQEINSKIDDKVFLIQYVKNLDQRTTHYFLTNNINFNFDVILEKSKSVEINKGGKSQIAVLKKNFLEIGGYDERIFGWGYEDSDLYFRLTQNGLTSILADSVGIHLWHETSSMFKFRKDSINLQIHQENIDEKNIFVDNTNVTRLDNQWNFDSIPIKLDISTNLNKWNFWYKDLKKIDDSFYGGNSTYVKASEFLKDMGEVEDWGCGKCGFKKYFTGKYIALDGSYNKFIDKIVDLETYCSNVESILIRHVLEHNYNWKNILENACKSFQKKMCLILFTPFADKTTQIFYHDSMKVPDLSLSKDELIEIFKKFKIEWTLEENIETKSMYKIEHAFYLTKEIK